MRLTRLIATPAILTYAAIVAGTLSAVHVTSVTTAQAQSISACERYAHDQARRATRGTATRSAARNTLFGAGLGSLVDGRQGARRGANVGLGVGVVAGGLSAHSDYEMHFNRAFRRCMRI